MQSACLEGADCLNYCRVVEFLRRGEMLSGARLRDEFSGSEFEAEERVVVNATGPWTDETCSVDDSSTSAKLRPTKGAHIMVRRERASTRNALPVISPRDQRLLFIVPWGKFSLIGTTDTDYEGDYDNVHADRDDVEYIMEATNLALPNARLTMDDIVSTYAGLRPLICEQGSSGVKESQVSREHSIYESPLRPDHHHRRQAHHRPLHGPGTHQPGVTAPVRAFRGGPFPSVPPSTPGCRGRTARVFRRAWKGLAKDYRLTTTHHPQPADAGHGRGGGSGPGCAAGSFRASTKRSSRLG